MTVAWPESLPRFSLPDSRETTYEQAIREFQADIGDPIRRVVQSNSVRILSGTYRFTTEQLNTFWTFYNTTLNYGIDAFTVWDSEAQTNVTVKFASASPPSARTIMRGWHDVSLVFRVTS